MTEQRHAKRAPLIRVVKREELPVNKKIIYYTAAVAAAVTAGGIFMAAMGVNPFLYFSTALAGCFRSKLSVVSLIRIIVPLLITSLGVSLAFKMKFWNIGAEGQFIIGAVGASAVALSLGETLPHWLLMILMAAAAILFSGLWGAIAAFFKCRMGTNETLLTLMLNYVAFYIIQYLRDGPWRDPEAGGFPKISKLPQNAWIDRIGGLDISWILALLLTAGIFVYLKYTKQGYEISVVGDSADTARYAGMNNFRIITRTMFLSAAVCGLGGMLQTAGDATSHTLSMGVASGVGFTAIIVAWLAKLSPAGILAVSALFGMLEKGCGVAESAFGVSSSVSNILQGIILFIILGADFFVSYKPVFGRKKEAAHK